MARAKYKGSPIARGSWQAGDDAIANRIWWMCLAPGWPTRVALGTPFLILMMNGQGQQLRPIRSEGPGHTTHHSATSLRSVEIWAESKMDGRGEWRWVSVVVLRLAIAVGAVVSCRKGGSSESRRSSFPNTQNCGSQQCEGWLRLT